MPQHILTVLTPDRPRIIASLCACLVEQQVAIANLSQTVVGHYFTIILVVELPPGLAGADLQGRLADGLEPSATITLVPLAASERPARDSEIYVLTLVGPGDAAALASLSAVLANAGGNILDLSAQLAGAEVQLIAEVALPAQVAIDQLQIDLQHATGEGVLDVRLQHQRLFQATNEIAFRRIDHSGG